MMQNLSNDLSHVIHILHENVDMAAEKVNIEVTKTDGFSTDNSYASMKEYLVKHFNVSCEIRFTKDDQIMRGYSSLRLIKIANQTYIKGCIEYNLLNENPGHGLASSFNAYAYSDKGKNPMVDTHGVIPVLEKFDIPDVQDDAKKSIKKIEQKISSLVGRLLPSSDYEVEVRMNF